MIFFRKPVPTFRDQALARRRDRRLGNLGLVAGRRPRATLAQGNHDLVGVPALLDVRGIGARQRTVQPVFGAVGVDPVPDLAFLALRAGDVDGAAMAITAGATAAAMQRVADAGLESGGEVLAVIIAEGAQ